LLGQPGSTVVERILGGLNAPQREAVEHEGGPLLVLAGAGSGKTRVLTRRVAWLIARRGVRPSAILAVTFTNKAAGEMKARILSLVSEAGKSVWTGTFHSVGARMLRIEAERAGIGRDFSIFDRADSLSAVKRLLAEMGIDSKEHSPESLLAVVSRAKNDMKSAGQLEEEAQTPRERLVARVYREYDQALRAQNALDFDDLLVRPVRLLDDEELREKWARIFSHVLVDEYQDTNACQYELLRRVTGEHRQLFVVGDDDQSIYRWRGADLSNILDFEHDHPDARIVRLEQNYRSTRMILGAANSVIRRNAGRKGKELWTENGEGERVLVLDVSDDQAEALAVLRMVKAGLEEESRSPSDFVVLYRTNAQSRVLENTFQLARVPYQVVGGQRFYDRREVKDVLAYLRLLANPADDVSLRRIINIPTRGIGKKSLEELEAVADATGLPLLGCVRRAAAGQGDPVRPALIARLGEFLAVLDRVAARAATAPVTEVAAQILAEIGYKAHLEKEDEREAVARWENVTELLAAMQEFVDAPGREDVSVTAFLQDVSLATDIDDFDEDEETVTLMTLHNAKGLEFPCVFITGVEEGLCPHVNSAHEPEGLEEERRLFYVGITRAQHRVALLHAGARRRYGGFNLCSPSRFLDELDPRFVERRSLAPTEADRRRAARAGSWKADAGAPEETVDYLPSYEDDVQDAARLEAGMRVRHPTWGEGVIDAVEGRGENLKLTIRFRGGVVKKVLAIYANLELAG
jgi:DNA helicase-2/ATP-dependent DNA helicase PcrA